MIPACPADDELVEPRIDKVLTQYRESPKLLAVMRTYLRQVEQIVQSVCDLPSFFDIDTATGDQLTLLGKRLGWPRCHCVCQVSPVFGFECLGVNQPYPIAGFCDGNATWVDCGTFGTSEICISDDELYRKFLKVRRYQILPRYDILSLEEAIRIFWGEQAMILDANSIGEVTIGIGRELTVQEEQVLQLYPRVLPVAPGIRALFHFDRLTVFGFGTGWGGFCEDSTAANLTLGSSTGDDFIDHLGNPIVSSQLSIPVWMCGVDVLPYECASV